MQKPRYFSTKGILTFVIVSTCIAGCRNTGNPEPPRATAGAGNEAK